MFLICSPCSLLFVQQIGGFSMDATLDGSMNDELWAAQQQYFGSAGPGPLTLLLVAMGGADWNIAQPLIEPLGLQYI